jgi:hypothetical protein
MIELTNAFGMKSWERYGNCKKKLWTYSMSDYNRFCDLQDQLKTQIGETRKKDKENYMKKIHTDTSLKMLWKKVD